MFLLSHISLFIYYCDTRCIKSLYTVTTCHLNHKLKACTSQISSKVMCYIKKQETRRCVCSKHNSVLYVRLGLRVVSVWRVINRLWYVWKSPFMASSNVDVIVVWCSKVRTAPLLFLDTSHIKCKNLSNSLNTDKVREEKQTNKTFHKYKNPKT